MHNDFIDHQYFLWKLIHDHHSTAAQNNLTRRLINTNKKTPNRSTKQNICGIWNGRLARVNNACAIQNNPNNDR